MPLIYCVEDDENIRELVGYALRSQQFDVETFADGKSFWSALEQCPPSLILLDIMLPGESGTDILAKIRKNRQYEALPVIMLTAKTSEYDIVRGLDNGADDYVCKPFGIVELISRIRAVLRRSKPRDEENTILSYGPVTLNSEKHTVMVNGDRCHLTVKEFELLRYLLVNIDIVLKREQIMEAVWGFTYEGESRTIDMHIKSLRQKLGEGGQIIRTVRGIGYVIGGNV
ncbi:MAG: response regulator transcription factor [Megasphaera sp.]|jgi:two-component system alkaline phosphatase synthesis response regulator PhoP|nr:response regulator transcription factor [Megasphaera sp.]MCH4187024.1 response regulator transcription factor [Megasphaera sp.]MCH4217040.1 response regulator transcription factor [Megasphaera sp.]